MARFKYLYESKWFKRLTNKYFLATLFFSFWMLFIDRSSLVIQSELDSKLKALNDGINFYQKELTQTENQIECVFQNIKYQKNNFVYFAQVVFKLLSGSKLDLNRTLPI